jgi:hypothetical protein
MGTNERERRELEKLRRFYRRIARLTVQHDDLEGHAVVYANKLGAALQAVSVAWTQQATRRRGGHNG